MGREEQTPELTFDEELHRYWYNGHLVPSVTQVIDACVDQYRGVPFKAVENARLRGEAVHRATEYLDDGTLDWGTLDGEVADYLAQYMAAKDQLGIEILEIEQRLFSERMWFAGTIDRLLTLKRPIAVNGEIVIPDGVPVVADLKATYKLMPTIGPQLAAYSMLYAENKGEDHPYRLSIRLSRDKFELTPIVDPVDAHVWASMLTIYKWRKRHNV